MTTTKPNIMNTPVPDGMDLLNFSPIGQQCLVEILEVNDRTEGGLYLPTSALSKDGRSLEEAWGVDDPPMVGRVAATGPDVALPQPTKEGDPQHWYVLFLWNSGVRFTAGHRRFILIEAPAFLAEWVN